MGNDGAVGTRMGKAASSAPPRRESNGLSYLMDVRQHPRLEPAHVEDEADAHHAAGRPAEEVVHVVRQVLLQLLLGGRSDPNICAVPLPPWQSQCC